MMGGNRRGVDMKSLDTGHRYKVAHAHRDGR